MTIEPLTPQKNKKNMAMDKKTSVAFLMTVVVALFEGVVCTQDVMAIYFGTYEYTTWLT